MARHRILQDMDGYFGTWKKIGDFRGRTDRREYWTFFLFNIIIAFMLGFIEGIVWESGRGILGTVLYWAFLISCITVSIRRMHDVDLRGWWMWVPIVSLVLAVSEGTRGDNRFGPDPKAKDVIEKELRHKGEKMRLTKILSITSFFVAFFCFGIGIWNYETQLETLETAKGWCLIAGAWIVLQSTVTLFQIAKKKTSERIESLEKQVQELKQVQNGQIK